MSNVTTGTVKWFNDAKGFGFITRATVAKIFSHTSRKSRARASRP